MSSSKKGSKKQFVVGAAIDTELKFANLPLVGNIPGVKDLALTTIGFSYTNVDPKDNDGKPVKFPIPKVNKKPNPLFTRQDAEAKQSNIYRIAAEKNDGKYTLNKKGFSLTVGLKNLKSNELLNNLALPLSLPSTKDASEPSTFDTGKTSPPAGPIHWIKVDKTFGPVSLKQLGINYSAGEATFGFSADFSMAGFNLALQGMAITFPMPLPGQPAGNKVGFDLQGLGLGYKKGSLELGGAFLKVTENEVNSYYGLALIKFAKFGLKAVGGYTPASVNNPAASFFLYANLQVPIGGPPFLFITGLAAGFGINNSLKLPTIDGLSDFIMLPNNAPAAAGSPTDTISKVLPQMQSVFKPEPGAYWIAAGIQFTSFEMVDAFVLVTVSFGVDFKVAVIGSAAMTFPKGAPTPVAYVEVDLLASFTPSTGLLAVDAKLSPSSYLVGGFCKLSGGFAFYAWFDGPNKGNFVITLGGYHPNFDPPAYYPTVPRLGMSFGLGPFQVSGQAYFALTPSAMMAGLRMDAVWKSGGIKAWFSAGVDFLIAWAPFHYEAGIYISVGCSADLGLFTIDLHIGADLQVWGPKFGGRAHIDLDVIAFTIEFGSKASLPPPVGWEAFSTGFLPKPTEANDEALLFAAAAPTETTNIIKANVAEGLADTDVDGFNWIVDSSGFSIVTNSTIPANNGEWMTSENDKTSIPNTIDSYGKQPAESPFLKLPSGDMFSKTEVWEPTINIGPMDEKDVQSYHSISLIKLEKTERYLVDVSIQPILESANTALWALNKDGNDNPNQPLLIPHTLSGFAISPIPRTPSQLSDIPLIELIFAQGFSTGFSFTAPAVNSDFTVKSHITDSDELNIDISGQHTATLLDRNYELKSLIDPWVASQRNTLLDDLNEAGFSTYSRDEVDLDIMAEKSLTDWPTVALLGN